MKKFILALAAMVLTAGLISAQDMAQATELAKNGNDALGAQNYTEALNYFQQALDMATQLEGDEAAALVEQCKGIIPNIALEIAKDLIKDKKYEEAASKIDEVKKIAEEYEVFDVYDTASVFCSCFTDYAVILRIAAAALFVGKVHFRIERIITCKKGAAANEGIGVICSELFQHNIIRHAEITLIPALRRPDGYSPILRAERRKQLHTISQVIATQHDENDIRLLSAA